MTTRDDWQRRLGPLYGGAVALVHSTPWRWPTQVADSPRAAGWLVALGAPIGVVAWCVAALARAAGLTPGVAALLGLATLSLASAALIERGLAERVDRWEGRVDRSGRPGVAALLAVMFATLVRAAAISALPPSRWLAVLVATTLVGRWAAVFLQVIGDPIRDEVRRSLVAAPPATWGVVALSVAVGAIAVLALGKAGLVALALAAVAAFALGLDAQRRDGELSAPVVATAAALGELIVLAIATI